MKRLLALLILASCSMTASKPPLHRDPQFASTGGQALMTAYETRLAAQNGTMQFLGSPFAYELAAQDRKTTSNYGFHANGNNVNVPLATFCADFDAPIAPPGKLFEIAQPNALNLPAGTLFRVSNQFYNELIIPSEKLGQNSDIFIPAGSIFTFNSDDTSVVSVNERLGSHIARTLDAVEKVDMSDPAHDRIRERDLLQHIVWDAAEPARPDTPVKTSGSPPNGAVTPPAKNRRDRICKIVISTYPQATESQQKKMTDKFESDFADLEKRVKPNIPAGNTPRKVKIALIVGEPR